MRAIYLDEFGGPDTLKQGELPEPLPAGEEVQIRVEYAGVNPIDWKVREGLAKGWMPHRFPLIPGFDCSGTVSAVGPGVTEFREGDPVYAYVKKPLLQWGTYAEFVSAPVSQVASIPANLTRAEAASMPVAALTAWQAVMEEFPLAEGQTVLVHAGAGGCGGLAIQLAKAAGARVFTTASAKNHDYVRALGADRAIDYGKEDFAEVLQREAGGADLALLFVDGVEDKTLDALKEDGALVSIVGDPDAKRASRRGVRVSSIAVEPGGAQLRAITALIEDGRIGPLEIVEMRLDDAAQAHREIQTGHVRGKIVLRV